MNHAEYDWEPAAGQDVVLDVREPSGQDLGSPSGVFEAREPWDPSRCPAGHTRWHGPVPWAAISTSVGLTTLVRTHSRPHGRV